MVAVEVLPNLWLGDIRSALDAEFITHNRITTVINCTVKYPFTDTVQQLKKIRVSVRDRGNQEDSDVMYEYLKQMVPVIHTLLVNGHRILVHCYAGCHRSVCLVIGYLMCYGKMSMQESIDTLQSKWPRLGLNFLTSLARYSVDLRQSTPSAPVMDPVFNAVVS